ncbi:MAG: hypothetical protein KKA67_15920 [Spirochaetes bacterium]|nr:hypothetical protein [Spirochaetota bacterium]MBU1082236.1 hypothetical protein [Spirochaetota bacterium]
MNRRYLPALVAVLASLVAPATALDFGAFILNGTRLSGDGAALSLSQEDQVVAWISMPVGASSSLYASARYQFYGDFYLSPSAAPALVPYLFTAGRVEWEGFHSLGDKSSVKWSIGRVPFQDFSGRVVNGLLDGAKAELSVGTVQASAAVAYTGLTFKDDAKILIDADDEARWADTAAGWPSDFAVGRLVASLGARFIELLPKHDFGLEAWAQFDLDTAGTVITNTQYAEPYIEGRIGRALRWRLWAAAEFGQDPSFFYAMAAGARLRLALPEVLGLRVTASSAWAGGDYDAGGVMRAFKPITAGSLAMIGSAAFSDAMNVSLDASVSPWRGLSVGSNVAGVLSPGAADPYLGLDASARVSFAPFNDLSASLSGGVFMPNTVADPDSSLSWSVSLSAQVRL